MMHKSKMYGIIGFSVIVLVIAGVSIINLIKPNPITEMDVLGPTSDFTLPSIDGSNYTFSSDIGKVRVMSLFYTRCQAGCSVIQSKMASVRKDLIKEEVGSEVKFISIDFDYKYDNMSDLREFAEIYTLDTASWQWLHGNQSQIEQVSENWDFYYEEVNMNNVTDDTSEYGDLEVVYSHIFVVYIIDRDGFLRHKEYGISWESEKLYNYVDFLINEE